VAHLSPRRRFVRFHLGDQAATRFVLRVALFCARASPHMKARIRIISGPLAGQIVEVCSKLLIGREEDCDLCPPCEFLSRHHCALLLDDFTLRIRDLGSKNGTFVNGHRIASGEAILLHDDLVAVGATQFLIEVTPQSDQAIQSTTSSAEMKGTSLFDTRTVEDDAPAPAEKPQESQRPLC
jgi:hypothetical protein